MSGNQEILADLRWRLSMFDKPCTRDSVAAFVTRAECYVRFFDHEIEKWKAEKEHTFERFPILRETGLPKMSLSWVSDHISSEFDEKIAEAVDNRRELEEVLNAGRDRLNRMASKPCIPMGWSPSR
jgi:uncharacterized protein YllA (UPF0747 family)